MTLRIHGGKEKEVESVTLTGSGFDESKIEVAAGRVGVCVCGGVGGWGAVSLPQPRLWFQHRL